MFRKEVLKGETAEAQLKKASKNNININAERHFPVCDPATGRTPRESICFWAFTRNLFTAVTEYLTEQHSLFPSIKNGRFVYFGARLCQSKSPSGSSVRRT